MNLGMVIDLKRCIGCGVCVETCPTGAIQLTRKPADEQTASPKDQGEWNEERGRARGVDFSAYK